MTPPKRGRGRPPKASTAAVPSSNGGILRAGAAIAAARGDRLAAATSSGASLVGASAGAAAASSTLTPVFSSPAAAAPSSAASPIARAPAAAPAATTTAARGPGRPRTADLVLQKQIGDSTFPVSCWSLTVARRGGDVDLSLLDATYAFIKIHTIRGGVSTEVGSRAHNLHLQGMFECRYPRDPTSVKALTKFFKDAVIKPRTGYAVVLKPFGKGQDFICQHGWIHHQGSRNEPLSTAHSSTYTT